jgi:hypothetical protein
MTNTDPIDRPAVRWQASFKGAKAILRELDLLEELGDIVEDVAETDTHDWSVKDVLKKYGYPPESLSVGTINSDADGFKKPVRIEHEKSQQKIFRDHVVKSDFIYKNRDEIDVLVFLFPVGDYDANFKRSVNDLRGEFFTNYCSVKIPILLIEYVAHDGNLDEGYSDEVVDEQLRLASRALSDPIPAGSIVYEDGDKHETDG